MVANRLWRLVRHILLFFNGGPRYLLTMNTLLLGYTPDIMVQNLPGYGPGISILGLSSGKANDSTIYKIMTV